MIGEGQGGVLNRRDEVPLLIDVQEEQGKVEDRQKEEPRGW